MLDVQCGAVTHNGTNGLGIGQQVASNCVSLVFLGFCSSLSLLFITITNIFVVIMIIIIIIIRGFIFILFLPGFNS